MSRRRPLQATEPSPVAAPSAPQDLQSTSEPEPSILLPLDEAKPRSEQLEAIARQADRHVRHGFDLAGKGAYFAARAEFVAALRLLAQGLDAEHQTKAHSQSLSAALMALQEAEDFIPKGSQLEADLDLPASSPAIARPCSKTSTTRRSRP